jgi:hypothetical protein
MSDTHSEANASAGGAGSGATAFELYQNVLTARRKLRQTTALISILLLCMIFLAIGLVIHQLRGFTEERLRACVQDHLPNLQASVENELSKLVKDLRPELETTQQYLAQSAPRLINVVLAEGKTYLVELRKVPHASLQAPVSAALNAEHKRLLADFPNPKDKAKVEALMKRLDEAVLREANATWNAKCDPQFMVAVRLEEELRAFDATGAQKVNFEKLESGTVLDLIMQSVGLRKIE